jgi:type IX secretion system PorP/SprF family membrane protein
MKKIKNSLVLIIAIIFAIKVNGQDPSFSQFFSSPLNINPALTAHINEKWRVISNYRNQWITPTSPYKTGTVSMDSKIFQNTPGNYVDENTRIGIGGMMMFDEAMGGVLKSNYGSFNLSGNILLANRGGLEQNGRRVRHRSKIKMDAQSAEQRLGIGLGVIYGNKRLDYSKLDFGEQFTGTGFNTNLPTGEAALNKMKPYISTSAGIIYSLITDKTNFDLGVSAFHFNKPRQTFIEDDKQFLATRYVAHGNLEAMLTDQVILTTNGIYQYQSGASYFSIGGALGYMLPNDEKDVIVNAGLWYWSNNAVIPYFGFTYGNFQVGLTYDITISKLNAAAKKFQTLEFCLIVRGKGKTSGVIPAPWK